MTFTEKQMALLFDAEVHFINVCTRECLRNAPQWLTERVISVYEDATGKKLQYKANCSACAFHVYKTVGKLYLSDKEELAAKTSILPDTKDVKQAEQKETPKNIKTKKNGRKKGTGNNV